MAKTAAWQRKEGKNPEGGLNAKGRASYKRETGGTLKPPVSASQAKKSKKSAARRKSGLLMTAAVCHHVYEYTGKDLCPSCGKPTHEINWDLTHEQHRDWISSGKATLQGWWSI